MDKETIKLKISEKVRCKCDVNQVTNYVLAEELKNRVDLALPLNRGHSSFYEQLKRRTTDAPRSYVQEARIIDRKMGLILTPNAIKLNGFCVKELLPETDTEALLDLLTRIKETVPIVRQELTHLVQELYNEVLIDIKKEDLLSKLEISAFHQFVSGLLPPDTPITIEDCNDVESEVFIGKYVPRHHRRFYRGNPLLSVRLNRAALNDECSGELVGPLTKQLFALYARWLCSQQA